MDDIAQVDDELDPGPSRYAVQIRCLSPTGLEVGKASGFLVQSGQALFAVTNWHVVTGGRIHRSSREREEEYARNGPARPQWRAGTTVESTPHAVTLSVHLYGRSRRVGVLALEVIDPPGLPVGTYRAWEALSLFSGIHGEPEMPDTDVAVLKVTDDVDHLKRELVGNDFDLYHRLGALGYPPGTDG